MVSLFQGSFTDTFSPISDLISEQREQKLTFDAIQMGLGILAGFTFSSWFQKLSYFKRNPHNLGVTGDTTQVVIGTSFAFVKDAMEAQSSLPIQNNSEQSTSTHCPYHQTNVLCSL